MKTKAEKINEQIRRKLRMTNKPCTRSKIFITPRKTDIELLIDEGKRRSNLFGRGF